MALSDTQSTKNSNLCSHSFFDELAASFRKHVIFKYPEEADAITLWCAGTYLMDVWQLFPKLLINSPERECGKTTLLFAIEALVENGMIASSITPAAIYRIIENHRPTLLIDEADRFLRFNEELNGIINAGHTRRTATRIHCEKSKDGTIEQKKFSLWGAQVIAGIGGQADTLTSRSIEITLRRKAIDETVARMPFDYVERSAKVRKLLKQWAIKNSVQVSKMTLDGPNGASDRTQDNWTPLVRVAAAIGGDWPDKARKAFAKLEITEKDHTASSLGLDLLKDIHKIMYQSSVPEMGAAEITEALIKLPDTEWRSLQYGRPITSKRLNQKLGEYRIRPIKRRDKNVYLFSEIEDNLKRYLPQHTKE